MGGWIVGAEVDESAGEGEKDPRPSGCVALIGSVLSCAATPQRPALR